MFTVTVPTAPPQNVAIQSATATQLDVTWNPPPVDAQNGDIQGYKVRLPDCHTWPQYSIFFVGQLDNLILPGFIKYIHFSCSQETKSV